MIADDRKNKFLEELAESGIIAVAAKRVGISRSTVYEWKEKSKKFDDKFDKALEHGRDNWSDFSENQLHGLIKDKKLGAIKFYLESNSKRYYKPRKPVAPRIDSPPVNINITPTKYIEKPEPQTLTDILKAELYRKRDEDKKASEAKYKAGIDPSPEVTIDNPQS